MLTQEQTEQFRALLTALSELVESLDSEPVEPDPPEEREYDSSGWSKNYIEPGARYSQLIDGIWAEVAEMPASASRSHLLNHPLLNSAFVCNTPDWLNAELPPEQELDRSNNVSKMSIDYGRDLYAFRGRTDPIEVEEYRQQKNRSKRNKLSDWRNFGGATFNLARDYQFNPRGIAGDFDGTIVLHRWWRCETDEHIAQGVRNFVNAVIEHGPAVSADPFSQYS